MNVWVPQLGLWVDDGTGNTYDPNEGFWRNPDRTMVYGGVYGENWQQSPGGGLSQASSAVSGYNALSLARGQQQQQTTSKPSSTSFVPNAGYQGYEDEAQRALAKTLQDLQSASAERIADIQSKTQLAVSSGQISQSEAEFVRNYALQQESQRFAEEMGRAQLDISKRAQSLAERTAAAQLAANPSDWIAYQYFTRQPGYQQQAGLPPGYSDAQIQDIANSLMNPGTQDYNPGLQGTGAFGAQVQAPNTYSRAEVNNLSPTQQEMVSGLVRAGVKDQSGNTVPINPDDYWSQVQKSFVPTLSSANRSTQYA